MSEITQRPAALGAENSGGARRLGSVGTLVNWQQVSAVTVTQAFVCDTAYPQGSPSGPRPREKWGRGHGDGATSRTAHPRGHGCSGGRTVRATVGVPTRPDARRTSIPRTTAVSLGLPAHLPEAPRVWQGVPRGPRDSSPSPGSLGLGFQAVKWGHGPPGCRADRCGPAFRGGVCGSDSRGANGDPAAAVIAAVTQAQPSRLPQSQNVTFEIHSSGSGLSCRRDGQRVHRSQGGREGARPGAGGRAGGGAGGRGLSGLQLAAC